MHPVAATSRKPVHTLIEYPHRVAALLLFRMSNGPDVALAGFCDDEGSGPQIGAESCGAIFLISTDHPPPRAQVAISRSRPSLR